MRKRLIGMSILLGANAVIFAQVGRLGPATVVDPSGTIAASRGIPDGPPQPAPRLSDGTVNLGRDGAEKGIWGLPSIQNFAGFTPHTPKDFNRGQRGGAPNEPFIPFQPWAAAVYNYNSLTQGKYDPEGFCFPPGGPRSMATPFPAEIIQLPEQKRILIIYEGGTHIWREIFMDGRPHPPRESIESETWKGHSVGRWEGDSLVIDSVGFNEGTWLDFWGHPHTNLLHLVERITRPTKQTLHYEATIDDPGAYTRSWTVAWDIPWRAGQELKEYICQENNQWLIDLKDDFGKPFFGRQ